jgi:bacterioferritin-associated ferredoxin
MPPTTGPPGTTPQPVGKGLITRTIRNTVRSTMIVCVCHQVSDRDIQRQVDGGCDSFEALQFELGVSTGCGICRDCAEATFGRCASRAGQRTAARDTTAVVHWAGSAA